MTGKRIASLGTGGVLTRDVAWLLAIFLVALALRVTWIHFVDPSPTDGRLDDAAVYHRTATGIMNGEGFRWEDRYSPLPDGGYKLAPTAYWSVGYPAMLAGIYFFTGPDVSAAKLFNAVLGAATCVLVYFVGREVFGRRVGLVAAGVLAVFPSQVFMPTLLMTETAWAFATMALLALALFLTLKRPTWWGFALTGVAFGAASLIRGEMLAFPLVLVVVWAVRYGSFRRAARYGAVTVAAMLVALMPWTIRNWVQLDYPVLVSTGSADNLLAGHWVGADGLGSLVPGLAVNERYSDLALPEREVAVYKEETRQALRFIVHNPRTELELIPKKLNHFYARDSRPLDLIRIHPDALSEARKDMFANVANVYYYVVGAAVILGVPLWFSLRDPRRLLIVALVLYYSVLFGFVFIGEERLHAALIPVFALLAAPLLLWAGERALRLFRQLAPV